MGIKDHENKHKIIDKKLKIYANNTRKKLTEERKRLFFFKKENIKRF